MTFQKTTIMKALQRIEAHEYVLPAIQREFVWRPSQICRLFDSLMLGYPIGSFLFWKVQSRNTQEFRFYDFMQKYHQRNNPHCEKLELMGDRDVVAVLDGQQRLTALNIGLRGSLAIKEPRKWWSNPDAFPTKRLYLNLLSDASDNEDGMRYDFRFLKNSQARVRDNDQYWFPVASVFELEKAPDVFRYLQQHELLHPERDTFGILDRLREIVREGELSYYLEEEQDLDKVLNIFIRINSGGTVLSYSDLLLSIATAQWDEIDARAAIYALVDELNDVRMGFNLSKDFVLKAGLMLTDVPSIGFKVTNFNAENMRRLEQRWEQVIEALRLTVRLVADFGFSDATLSAASALLPIAYYLHRLAPGDRFLRAREFHDDRQQIRTWLLRSLLKAGVWGSGLDGLLTGIRTAIAASPRDAGFPREAIEAEMMRRGRSLRFEEDEIQDLLDVTYSSRRAFAMLALLYPFADLRNQFHVDHFFPRSLFTPTRLRRAEIPEEAIESFRDAYDRLPNLILLNGTANQEKSNKLPADWLAAQFDDSAQRLAFCARHDLDDDIPGAMTGFLDFYARRRARIAIRLRQLLGVEEPEAIEEPALRSTNRWSAELYDLLELRWHGLARALEERGLREPDAIGAELLRGGITTAHHGVMSWDVDGVSITLALQPNDGDPFDSEIVPVHPDADPDDVADRLRDALD